MSLFQIDAGKEWRGGQRQSFLLAQGLKNKGYPFYFVVQPQSPLHELAQKEDLPVIHVISLRQTIDMARV